jgi:hypothetical protein
MAAALAVMAGGWYFALAQVGPDAALVLGLLYGVFLFPHFIQPRRQPFAMWIRISVVACATALLLGWMIFPLLPRKPISEVRFDLVRVTTGEKSVVAPSLEGAGVSGELAALNIRGETHGGVEQTGGAPQNAPQIDVQLIALGPITKEAKLAIPKMGFVVYVLKGGVWTAHPSILAKDKRTLTIEPGTDPQYDGGRVKLGKEAKFSEFTWYPAIRKGQ